MARTSAGPGPGCLDPLVQNPRIGGHTLNDWPPCEVSPS